MGVPPDSRSMPAQSAARSERVDAIRGELLDRVWRGAFALALIGTPASVSRALSTGWLPLYSVHLAVGALVVLLYCMRRRLSFAVRTGALLLIFFLIGVAGLFTLGLLGAGLWWLVVSSLLAGTLVSHRAGLAMAAVSLATISLAAVGFTRGILTVPVDPAVYVYEMTSWVSFLLAASIMPFLILQSIALFQRSTLQMVDEVERQKAELELAATHDPLTGLPRWELVVDRLQVASAAARRAGRKVAFLFIDLDGFKAVNDTFGHDAGDHVLAVVGARLKAALRAQDTAGRIGGDEFAVILAGVATEEEARAAAERLVASLAAPTAIGNAETRIGASIGIALFPDHGEDPRMLRRRADAAMYLAKVAGKNRVVLAPSHEGPPRPRDPAEIF